MDEAERYIAQAEHLEQLAQRVKLEGAREVILRFAYLSRVMSKTIASRDLDDLNERSD
jgi:hypothetical protein